MFTRVSAPLGKLDVLEFAKWRQRGATTRLDSCVIISLGKYITTVLQVAEDTIDQR